MVLPLVYIHIVDPWAARESPMGFVLVYMPDPWVTLGSHVFIVPGHGSPMALPLVYAHDPWVAHGSRMNFHCWPKSHSLVMWRPM